MNTSERFFRRYIFSTVRIIVLFLAVNALLVASYFVIAYLGNVTTSKFPIEDFSNHIMATDGEFSADTQAKEMMNNFEAWAMILNDDGTVVWEENLPEELPRHYSSMDIAMFSRWYLDDYPTNIAKRQDGLLVIGLPPEKMCIRDRVIIVFEHLMDRALEQLEKPEKLDKLEKPENG